MTFPQQIHYVSPLSQYLEYKVFAKYLINSQKWFIDIEKICLYIYWYKYYTCINLNEFVSVLSTKSLNKHYVKIYPLLQLTLNKVRRRTSKKKIFFLISPIRVQRYGKYSVKVLLTLVNTIISNNLSICLNLTAVFCYSICV